MQGMVSEVTRIAAALTIRRRVYANPHSVVMLNIAAPNPAKMPVLILQAVMLR
jgi:hypothetical protein